MISRPGSLSTRFSPYTQAVLATLVGAYRLSKRQIQQRAGDLLGRSISTGMISKRERQSARALEAPYNELAAAVHEAGVIGADASRSRPSMRPFASGRKSSRPC